MFAAALAALFAAWAGGPAGAIPPSTGQVQDQPRAPLPAGPEIKRINAYLNSIHSLRARFQQVAPDGSISEGDFFLSRPGRLRFQYDGRPLLVVANGDSVVVHDARLDTYDRYPISSTPIDVLLDPTINVARDLWVTDIAKGGGLLRVTVRHPKAPQRGQITLVFTEEPFELRQWVVLDAQGLITEVTLSDVQPNVSLDPAIFQIRAPAPPPRQNLMK